MPSSLVATMSTPPTTVPKVETKLKYYNLSLKGLKPLTAAIAKSITAKISFSDKFLKDNEHVFIARNLNTLLSTSSYFQLFYDISNCRGDINDALEYRQHIKIKALTKKAFRAVEMFKKAVAHLPTTVSSMNHVAPKTPSTEQIEKDLLSLTKEFDGVYFDQKANTLKVVTNKIVLNKVDLGRFVITLDLNKLPVGFEKVKRTSLSSYYTRYNSRPYDISALDGPIGRSFERALHPHVFASGKVCEGNGKILITNALNSCDYYAFFLVVKTILNTYNAGNAIAPVSDWAEPLSLKRKIRTVATG